MQCFVSNERAGQQPARMRKTKAIREQGKARKGNQERGKSRSRGGGSKGSRTEEWLRPAGEERRGGRLIISPGYGGDPGGNNKMR